MKLLKETSDKVHGRRVTRSHKKELGEDKNCVEIAAKLVGFTNT
tara:strand:- start:317 stop:448 length:132 start_codon:yes stop_codon:yes gene_type:complete